MQWVCDHAPTVRDMGVFRRQARRALSHTWGHSSVLCISEHLFSQILAMPCARDVGGTRKDLSVSSWAVVFSPHCQESWSLAKQAFQSQTAWVQS